jgi:hypothetical protein
MDFPMLSRIGVSQIDKLVGISSDYIGFKLRDDHFLSNDI